MEENEKALEAAWEKRAAIEKAKNVERLLPEFSKSNFKVPPTWSELELKVINDKILLEKEVKEFIDDPEALQKYKKKHFKHEKNTRDIANLIHKAIVKKKE